MAEDDNIFVDERGGFRHNRSCIDQAFILQSLAKGLVSNGK